MTALPASASATGRRTLAGAPPGRDAFILVETAGATDGRVLYVARDDAAMDRMRGLVTFLAPDLSVVELPAWDCLPYDRISPHPDVVARRLDTLCALASDPGGAGVVMTTVNALLQRVPPRSALAGETLRASPGEALPADRLMAYLTAHGYHRTGTVREPGEYAVRGGLVDLFPPGAPDPLRLDFFGDDLESIRSFDAMSQRSKADAAALVLKPVNEVLLNESSIQRFRQGYRNLFGAVTGADPLYEAVSAGHRHPGTEHWLPLFHDGLETLFDYLGAVPVILDAQAEEAAAARAEMIAEHYDARLEHLQIANRTGAGGEGAEDGQAVYKPVPPAELYLEEAELAAALDARATAVLSPFALPEGAPAGAADAGGRQVMDFAAARTDPNTDLFAAAGGRVADEAARRRVLVTAHSAGSRERILALFTQHGLEGGVACETWAEVEALPDGVPAFAVLDLEHGFETDELIVFSEQDILGERLARPPRRRRRNEDFLTEVSSLSVGDYVVHVDHGIGRYDGLETLEVAGAPHDCLQLTYAGGDRLFLPVENIEVLSRFGSEDAAVTMDKLGGHGWQARKARVKERIREIAFELIKIAAERTLRKGDVLETPEGVYQEFCAGFGYVETDDQLRAIEDVLADFDVGRPMDRLICGDVGFGKTEVALRAAFIAAMAGKQVMVVVPTTLLARQHFATFTERFRGLPLRIEHLSRLVTGKQAAAVKQAIADGTVDIAIGTHALLAKSIKAPNLGLLVIDEEQHFGVQQKERLKQLRADVHVLTLTATPIPRTLQMALSGVKEMSVIATPPVDRLAIRTFVLPYDGVVVREAIMREHFRGGQVFYVCPRVRDLARVEERLRALVPDLKIATAHGQMAPRALEDVMGAFLDKRFDILLSTNIVESGLDIPNANTMIVHRADMFGLSQLYQLRGRIGRGKVRAYCYLTVPPGKVVTEAGEKRLQVMQTLDSLGAGFTLASHDLDIRGAGNLLGEEQSGHIREVGVELYQRMLEETVAALRSDRADGLAEETWSPTIALGTAVLIPERYVSDLSVRLGLYRRLSTLADERELEAFEIELVDRFGPLPPEVKNLLHVIAIKQLCKRAGVEKIDAGPKGAVVSFRNDHFAHPERLIGYIQQQIGSVKLRPDHKLVCMRPWEEPERRIEGVERLVRDLTELAGG